MRAMSDFFAAERWRGRGVEVLIVVERSTDGTLELAREQEQGNFRVIDNGAQRGKGYAVRRGMRQARGQVLFYMDADLSVPLEELDVFMDYLDAHPEVDVLLGSRQHPQSRIERRQSWLRQTMGKTFNHVLRCLSLLPYRDTQCGFKALRHPAAREIFRLQTINGFAFDVEVLMLAQALGYRIIELPVCWRHAPESRVHIVRDSFRMLRDAVSVRGRVNRILRFREMRAARL